MKSTFHQHIGVFEDAIPKEFCNDLIKHYKEVITKKDLNFQRAKINSTSTIIVKDTSIGKTEVNPKFPEYFQSQILQNIILPIYLKKYSGYFDLFTNSKVQYEGFNVQRTMPGEGYHLWHSEWGTSPEFASRSLVWTLYLNDVKEGGETEFLDIPFRLKPTTATICIFPSHATHFHRGNPPLSGAKFIATGWIHTHNPL